MRAARLATLLPMLLGDAVLGAPALSEETVLARLQMEPRISGYNCEHVGEILGGKLSHKNIPTPAGATTLAEKIAYTTKVPLLSHGHCYQMKRPKCDPTFMATQLTILTPPCQYTLGSALISGIEPDYHRETCACYRQIPPEKRKLLHCRPFDSDWLTVAEDMDYCNSKALVCTATTTSAALQATGVSAERKTTFSTMLAGGGSYDLHKDLCPCYKQIEDTSTLDCKATSSSHNTIQHDIMWCSSMPAYTEPPYHHSHSEHQPAKHDHSTS